MRLQIIGIHERGVPREECLRLRVLADADLSFYFVLDTIYQGPNALSTAAKHIFWFPPWPVKAGDDVLLYTADAMGLGRPHTSRPHRLLQTGSQHVFYWNQLQPLWAQPGNCAVVMKLSTWQTTPFDNGRQGLLS